MLRYIARRLLLLPLILFGVSVITFFVLRLIPGDYVDVMVATSRITVDEETLANLRAYYGLDKPLPEQYITWISNVLRGDLGLSLSSRRPVLQDILSRYPVTIELTVYSVSISTGIGIVAGILSAYYKDSWIDRAVLTGSVFGLSMPSFWLGTLFILFVSFYAKAWPIFGYVSPKENLLKNLQFMFLPAVALGTEYAASVMRIMRSAMLEVLSEDYVRTARAKGLAEYRVITRHVLKNTLIPVITVIGLRVAAMLGGAIVSEQVFSIPGVGRLVVDAVNYKDLPVVQGVVLFLALNAILINLIVDISYAWLDPKIKYE
jgi:peptide/nickel transport system permease protein